MNDGSRSMDHIDLDLAMTNMDLFYSDHIIRPVRSMCRYGVLGQASWEFMDGATTEHDVSKYFSLSIFPTLEQCTAYHSADLQ